MDRVYEPMVFRAIMHVEPDILLRSDVATANARNKAHLAEALLQYYEVEGALDDYRRSMLVPYPHSSHASRTVEAVFA